MSDQKLFVIHSYPIKYFPPAFNFVREMDKRMQVRVHTTIPHKPRNNRLTSVIRTIYFELCGIVKMIVWKPDVIMYYESASAFSPYIYKRYFNRKVKVCAHYHEYMTMDEYRRPGMRLSLYNHQLEQKWLYKHLYWLSHTSSKRLEMFTDDNPMIPQNITHIFPNYPPKSWHKKEKIHSGDVTKCVFIGSLSLKDTFVLEFCKWIAAQDGKVTFDVYSFNFHKDTLIEVLKLNSPHINFHTEGVDYDDIPALLETYNVGVILYKVHCLNVKWNDTNKFYEYLICGLDVCYPKEMLALHEMDKNMFGPVVKEMDFDDIDSFECNMLSRTVDNSGYHWFAEDVYNQFVSY